MPFAQTSTTQTLAPAVPQVLSKREQVKQVFEDVPHYLSSRRVDIRFRMDTVREFAGRSEWSRLLDIGCGDGSISLQLLKPESRLTLMDLSAAMASTARQNVPLDMANNVTIRNGDFLSESFDPHSFDLIVTVGVIAHVDSPDLFLAKIKTLLRPGGRLILEFTDAYHLTGRIGRFWGAWKTFIAPAKYETNKLSFASLAPLFDVHGLRLTSVFRYARIPLPAIDRILGKERHFAICKRIFGTCSHNRNAFLGNEYICLFTAD